MSVGIIAPAAAQSPAAPDPLYPIIRTFTPGDYDGSGQLWSVTQDSTGLLYIGGQRYLRQFDGVRWRKFSTTTSAQARSLAMGPEGDLYIGTTDSVDRLRPDSTGTFRIERLGDAVPDSLRMDARPFRLAALSDDVFVRTGPLLWRVREDSLHRFAPSLQIRTLHTLRDTLIVQREPDGALVRIAPDGSTRLWSNDPRLQADLAMAILPGASALEQIVVLARNGIARYSEADGLTTVQTPVDDLLRRVPITDAVRLSDGTVAVATAGSGILVVDPQTGAVRLLNTASGLPSNDVQALRVSPRGALWAATGTGLARINWPSPWTRLPGVTDRLSAALTFMRASDGLYIGGTGGLLRWTDGALRRVSGLSSSETVYDAVRVGPTVLVSASSGVYSVRQNRARRLMPWPAYGLLRSQQNNRIVYAGLLNGGLGRLRFRNGRWQADGRVTDADGTGYTVSQDASGSLWMGTGPAGIFRITWPSEAPASEATVARFDTTDGLYGPNYNFTAQIGSEVRFITHDGLYRFDSETQRFGPDSTFAAVYADSLFTGWPVEAPTAEAVWMDFGGYKFGVAKRQPNGTYTWTAQRFRRLTDYGDVESIYPEGDSLVWVGTANGVLRYDRRHSDPITRPFRTLVRRITINPNAPDAQRRTVYGGDVSLHNAPLRLSYDDNTLRFAFGATSYEQVTGSLYERDGPLEFRYQLDGYDDQWSAWSSEVQKDYTGLPDGTYTFRVQARNLANVVGQPAMLRLRVAPPWYRTGWAYALYAVGAVGLMAALVSLRTRHLRKRQQELEATVQVRTAEVRHQRDQLEEQKEQLERQKDRLAEQADELRALDEAKSRFFANLSHEFRTPLTLILGPVRRVRDRLLHRSSALSDEEAAEQLSVVERNTYRLLRMVKQLLDLARHDAGTLRVRAQPTDLNIAVQDIAQAFVPLAERQQLTLVIEADPRPREALPVYLDAELFKQILSNLLSNAIKFTPSGGQVTVRVRHTANTARVLVKDTGVGIPDAMQERIFERFAQADDTATRAQEGAGIGLALTKTLVDLHGGRIAVDSTEDAGTTFTFTVPRGAAHLNEEQIATSGERAEPSSESRTSASPVTSVPEANAPSARASDSPSLDASPPASSSATADTPLVLVVDDNADVRAYVRSILHPSFRIVEAATGAEGVQQAREHLPDVILADVMMPEMDGLTMTEQLRADPATEAIPIVMLTARAGTEDEIEGLSVGATDYVIKPFDPQVLEMRVRGTLAYQERLRRRLLRERRKANPEAPSGEASTEEPTFEDHVRAIITERLPDPNLNPDQLAEALAISRSTLYRRMKANDLPSPGDLIQEMRMTRAAHLLQNEAGTVSEIAYAVGFQSLSNFSKRFTQQFGEAPTAYASNDTASA